MFFLERHVTVIKNDVYLFFLKKAPLLKFIRSLSLSLFNDLQLKTHTSKSLTVEFKSSNCLQQERANNVQRGRQSHSPKCKGSTITGASEEQGADKKVIKNKSYCWFGETCKSFFIFITAYIFTCAILIQADVVFAA